MDSDHTTILDLFLPLARRRTWIALLALTFAGFAAFLSLVLPVRYTAGAVILPPQRPSSIALLALQLGVYAPLSPLTRENLEALDPNAIYDAILRSETVEDAVVRQFHLQKWYGSYSIADTLRIFRQNCDIQSGNTDDYDMIRVFVTDRDPQMAKHLANALVAHYTDLLASVASHDASDRMTFLTRQLDQIKEQLAAAENQLAEEQLSSGAIQLNTQITALIRSAVILRAQIAQQETSVRAMQTWAASDNPTLQLAQQELASLKAQLARVQGTTRSADSGLDLPRRNLPEISLDIMRDERAVQYYQSLFTATQKQFELAQYDAARRSSLAPVVSPAVAPDRKSYPHRTFIVLGAGATGLFLGIFCALIESVLSESDWSRLRALLLPFPFHGRTPN